MNRATATPLVSVEQLRYARWLDIGMHAGLLLLAVLFIAYLSGLLTPHVALERLPEVWGLPVSDYLQATGTPRGWQWLGLAGHIDIANLLGIVLLAGCSVPSLLALLPIYLQRRDHVYAALCVAEVLVLLLAASGLLSTGH